MLNDMWHRNKKYQFISFIFRCSAAHTRSLHYIRREIILQNRCVYDIAWSRQSRCEIDRLTFQANKKLLYYRSNSTPPTHYFCVVSISYLAIGDELVRLQYYYRWRELQYSCRTWNKGNYGSGKETGWWEQGAFDAWLSSSVECNPSTGLLI